MSNEYFLALIGGSLIGLSAVLLMLLNGRILGVSGIATNLLTGTHYSRKYSLAFILGMLATGTILVVLSQHMLPGALERSPILLAIAGLLVGFGTRFANGCTSGHGVCGLARFSRRSGVATLVFMLAAVGSVFLTNQIIGI